MRVDLRDVRWVCFSMVAIVVMVSAVSSAVAQPEVFTPAKPAPAKPGAGAPDIVSPLALPSPAEGADKKRLTKEKKLVARLLRSTTARNPDWPATLLRAATVEVDLVGNDPGGAAGRDTAKGYLEEIIKDFPTFDQMDAALMLLARLDSFDGKQQRSLRAAKQLIKFYPRSKLVPHCMVLFGDVMDANGSADKARKFYEKGTSFPRSDIYPYALLKLAWTHHQLGDAAKALDSIIRLHRALIGAHKNQRDEWADPARRALVVFYADVGQPAKARGLFSQTLEGTDVERALKELREEYRQRGNGAAAEQIR